MPFRQINLPAMSSGWVTSRCCPSGVIAAWQLARTSACKSRTLTYEIDQTNKEHLAAKVLEKGRVAYCKIALDAAVPVDPKKADGTSPVVLFLDSAGGGIVGIGIIDFALRRSTNISWHQTTVDQAARARVHNHQPCVSGLPVCPDPASRRLPMFLSKNSIARGGIPTCLTAITCAMDFAGISDLPTPIGWRISAGSRKWQD